MFFFKSFKTQTRHFVTEAQETLQGHCLPSCWRQCLCITPIPNYVSWATVELCIVHTMTVATGPSAHGLRWTKLCSLDLR